MGAGWHRADAEIHVATAALTCEAVTAHLTSRRSSSCAMGFGPIEGNLKPSAAFTWRHRAHMTNYATQWLKAAHSTLLLIW
jgi:hypothetical protein